MTGIQVLGRTLQRVKECKEISINYRKDLFAILYGVKEFVETTMAAIIISKLDLIDDIKQLQIYTRF